MGFLATLFSLLISAYPFVNVVNAHVYAIKILSMILLSNLVAFGFYHFRTRGAEKEKGALSRAA